MSIRRIAPALLVALGLGAVTIVAQEGGRGVPDTDAKDAALAIVTKSPFRFTPTTTGRVVYIETPVGTPIWHDGEYELCAGDGNFEGSSGFYPVSIVQTNGPGTLPLQITTRNNINSWQIKWSYTVDNIENELMLTAQVKRLISPTTYAYLEFGGDTYLGTFASRSLDANQNSAWYEKLDSSQDSGMPITMNNVTAGTHWAWIANAFDYAANGCGTGYYQNGPIANADRNGISEYYLGSLASGNSKKVQFQLRRHQ